MGIRCSVNTPYYVSLNNGLSPQNGDQRAMKSQTGNTYLKYDIFKNSSNDRWEAVTSVGQFKCNINPGVHNGVTQQNYVFTTKIVEENAEQVSSGNLSRYGHGTSRVLKLFYREIKAQFMGFYL
jgi:spore coat protein U-like protein